MGRVRYDGHRIGRRIDVDEGDDLLDGPPGDAPPKQGRNSRDVAREWQQALAQAAIWPSCSTSRIGTPRFNSLRM